jgi:hypothetical protein
LFDAPYLLPGTYQVVVEIAGFKKYESRDNKIDPNVPANISAVLQVGAVTETVEVTATASLLQTESGTLGKIVEGKQISDLQLNGRNAVFLAQLKPGVRGGNTNGFNFGLGTGGFNINGARSQETLITFDGAVGIRTRSNGESIGTADLDNVAEVQILTAGYGAGSLFVTDGDNSAYNPHRIYRIRPGKNRIFNGGGDDIVTSLKQRCQETDQACAALVKDLKQRGLLDETLVVVLSEMGRTPRVNGNAGRDHWTNCYGSLLAGGTIPKNDAYTVTAALPDQPVTALRLEMLPHESLPTQGPGLAKNGNLEGEELRQWLKRLQDEWKLISKGGTEAGL